MGWLRRKLGDEAASPALHTHSAGSRLQVKRAGRSGPVGLRARLLLALAYVLVLAVVALEVPLASSVADLLADSEGTPPGRSYSGRPEIAAALNGPGDQLERRSETLGRTLLVTSVPVVGGGRTIGAVRVSQSVEAVDRAVRRAWVGLALIGLLVIGLGLLAGWWPARSRGRCGGSIAPRTGSPRATSPPAPP